MTAKEYLSQARGIKIRVEAMAEQLEFLKSASKYVSPQYSDMPKPATRNVHSSEDAIVKVMAFEEKLNAQFAKLDEITRTINDIADPTQQIILTKHYIGGKAWTKIAQETFLCERHIRRLHKQALKEVDVLLKRVR